MASLPDVARRIKDDPASLIDSVLVAESCSRRHPAWRDRVLSPRRTLEAFATQIAHGNTAIAHVVRLAGGEFTESAYCQARQRLPVQVFRDVLRDTTARQLGAARAATGTWKGLHTFIADGTGCDMPEVPELQRHFGQPPNPGPGRGFPIAHVLTLFDAPSGLLLDMVVSPYATQDVTKMADFHSHLGPGDLVITDRGICAYVYIAMLAARGVHVVCRAHQGRTIPYPASPGPRETLPYNRHRRKTPILVERLGDRDQVVELLKPTNRPGWMTPGAFAAIPSKLTVRVLKFRVHEPGFRTKEIELMTTLLDGAAYPAAELAELYMVRWQIEVNLRHIKRTLGMTSLHCKAVDGVTKELLMFALVYNAVRAIMVQAATRQRVTPDRISFIDALRWIVHHREDEPLPNLKVNSKRPGRLYARAVKRSPSFPKLTATRATYREQVKQPI